MAMQDGARTVGRLLAEAMRNLCDAAGCEALARSYSPEQAGRLKYAEDATGCWKKAQEAWDRLADVFRQEELVFPWEAPPPSFVSGGGQPLDGAGAAMDRYMVQERDGSLRARTVAELDWPRCPDGQRRVPTSCQRNEHGRCAMKDGCGPCSALTPACSCHPMREPDSDYRGCSCEGSCPCHDAQPADDLRSAVQALWRALGYSDADPTPGMLRSEAGRLETEKTHPTWGIADEARAAEREDVKEAHELLDAAGVPRSGEKSRCYPGTSRPMSGRYSLADRTMKLIERIEKLRARIEEFEAWQAGARGAAAIARAPLEGQHTEQAYLDHQTRYTAAAPGSPYADGADLVGEIDLRRREAERAARDAEQASEEAHRGELAAEGRCNEAEGDVVERDRDLDEAKRLIQIQSDGLQRIWAACGKEDDYKPSGSPGVVGAVGGIVEERDVAFCKLAAVIEVLDSRKAPNASLPSLRVEALCDALAEATERLATAIQLEHAVVVVENVMGCIVGDKYRLGDETIKRLRRLASGGEPEERLLGVRPPVCPACGHSLGLHKHDAGGGDACCVVGCDCNCTLADGQE